MRQNNKPEDNPMRRKKRAMTLGDLIRTVSEFAHNDHEVGLAVADLMQRGVVRIRSRHRPQRRGWHGH